MNTPPVLFLIFNRPDLTKRVFDTIKRSRPAFFFVAADGPRDHIENEKKLTDECRAIVAHIDWPCEVRTLFRDNNLGCRHAVSSAIDWFFENVEEGIILEDDCLPDASFFSFCGELLQRFRHDQRVMSIAGSNFQSGISRCNYTYYFSKYPQIWGWATWKRAWSLLDYDFSSIVETKSQGLLESHLSPTEARHWLHLFRLVKEGTIDTWDYAWLLTCFINSGLTATPDVNLISNIGFDERATHTKNQSDIASLAVSAVKDIRHPEYVCSNYFADELIREKIYQIQKKQGPINKIPALFDRFLNRLSLR